PPSISALEDVITGPSMLFMPGDAEHSQVYKRAETLNASYRMPPLASSVAHTHALAILRHWIESTSTCE
ncbi:MAG TPA: hypothetical protein VLC93_04595, partial [Myxococcota bacterium]|nr:hypothetical protein [Myxococcota bacterium]